MKISLQSIGSIHCIGMRMVRMPLWVLRNDFTLAARDDARVICEQIGSGMDMNIEALSNVI